LSSSAVSLSGPRSAGLKDVWLFRCPVAVYFSVWIDQFHQHSILIIIKFRGLHIDHTQIIFVEKNFSTGRTIIITANF
jgi:hypothetical protein